MCLSERIAGLYAGAHTLSIDMWELKLWITCSVPYRLRASSGVTPDPAKTNKEM